MVNPLSSEILQKHADHTKCPTHFSAELNSQRIKIDLIIVNYLIRWLNRPIYNIYETTLENKRLSNEYELLPLKYLSQNGTIA